MTNNIESGALPGLGGDNDKVLGVPASTLKVKTNVTKLFYLVGFLGAGLFILFGVLFAVKAHKRAKAPAPTAQPQKVDPTKTANNAVENMNIDRMKGKLKKDDALADLQKKIDAAKAAQAASAAGATPGAASDAVPGGSGVVVAGATPGGRPGMDAKACVSTAGKPPCVVPRPTRQQLRLGGDVMFDMTPSQGAQAVSTPAPTVADAPGGAGGAGANAQRPANGPLGYNPYVTPPGAVAGGNQGQAQQQGESLEKRLEPTVLKARSAGRLGDLDYMLTRGTTVPCALKTGIDTTLPGFITCITTNDVYSANGKTLLIERSAKIFGEQRSVVAHGQARVFVLWTRVDNPSGVFAELDSPASDQMGYSGIPGYLDTHFWDRFGGAIMLSVINDALATELARATENSSQQGVQISTTSSTAQSMGQEALKASVNIPPTITVLPGTVVEVQVARDVSFESVYRVVR